jgi:hypothetical protein
MPAKTISTKGGKKAAGRGTRKTTAAPQPADDEDPATPKAEAAAPRPKAERKPTTKRTPPDKIVATRKRTPPE